LYVKVWEIPCVGSEHVYYILYINIEVFSFDKQNYGCRGYVVREKYLVRHNTKYYMLGTHT